MKHINSFSDVTFYIDSLSLSGESIYTRLGPLVFNQGIRKELGGYLSQYQDTLWFFAYTGSVIVGFSSIHFHKISKGIVLFDNAYTFPEHRCKGIHTNMFNVRISLIEQYKPIKIRVNVNSKSSGIYKRNGFSLKNVRGSWSVYEKVVL